MLADRVSEVEGWGARSHLAGEAVGGVADRTEEVVDVVVVNAPARTVRGLAVEGVVPGIVLGLGYGLVEVLLVHFRRYELR